MKCLARQKGGAKLRVRKRKANKDNKSEADVPPRANCQGSPTADGDGGMILEAGDSEDDGGGEKS